MEIQEWTKNPPVQKCADPYISNVTPLDVLDVNKFRTGRVLNTMEFYTVLINVR